MKYRIKELLKKLYKRVSASFDRIGKNKKYLIIKRNDATAGLASYLNTNLGAIRFALQNHVIPIIDMRTTQLDSEGKEKKVNVWELYFEQPCKIGIFDVRKKDSQVTGKIYDIRPNDTMDFLTHQEQIEYWRTFAKKYIRFNKKTNSHMKKVYQNLFSDKKNILGIMCRGTDYINLKPYGHPVQPSPREIIEKIKQLEKEMPIDYYFLATEDQTILDIFKAELQDKLIYLDTMRYQFTDKKYIAEKDNEDNIDVNQKNLNYLTTLYLLSKCDYFIGGRTSGTVCSMVLSDGYQYTYFWNKGRYGIDDQLSQKVGN